MRESLRRILHAAAAVPLAISVASPVAAHSPQDDDEDVESAAVAEDSASRADSSRWDFEFDFGFSGALGNSEYAIFTSGVKVEHQRSDQYAFAWTGAMRYGEGDEGVIARAFKSRLSFALEPESRWSPFVYTDVERDVFRRLAVRTNVGAGIKYNLVVDQKGSVALSATLAHDYKNFADPAGVAGLPTETNGLWSLRARGSRSLGGGADIDNTTWLKAMPGAPGDYDLDSTTKLSVPLSEHIGLKITYTLRRDSTPPPDIDKNDQLLQVGVTVGF